MRLFALNASAILGSQIASLLEHDLDLHEEREFSYGEHKTRSKVDVCGEDVYVISSLHGDTDLSVNDKICRLLFFIGALKDAGADRVTAVMPYLAYSRKDCRTQSRDPVTTRYVATVLQSVGTDRVVTADVHNPAAFDNGFRCPAVNLETTDMFADFFFRSAGASVDTIVSPDLGGIKTTQRFVDAYSRMSGRSMRFAVMDKRRSEGRVSGSGLIGDVGKHALIVDDMIGSGTTLCRAATACLEAGSDRVSVGATHGLFQDGAPALFAQSGVDTIAVTDTVQIDRLGLPVENRARVTVIPAADMFAQSIRDMRR